MGVVPDELTGVGRELWADAVAYLEANGRANRVYRHPLRLLCRAYETASQRGEIGSKSMEATRRWMGELLLTPAASMRLGGLNDEGKDDGPATLMRLVEGKRAKGA